MQTKSRRSYNQVENAVPLAASSHVIKLKSGDGNASDEEDDAFDVELISSKLETSTTSFSDDYAHQGEGLSALPYYVYCMHVTRVRRRN